MRIKLGLCSLAAAFGSAVSSGAQQPAPVPASPAVATALTVRRDVHGIQGISPFWEALKKGDNAYIARDFDAAVAAYQEAITDEPENGLGHYRMGEAQLGKLDFAEAEAAFIAGLRVVAADAPLEAKLEFALADLRERQKSYADAISKWNDYRTLSREQPAAKGFLATAVTRKKALEAWQKLSADAALVKARIEQRLQSTDESLRKSSK